MACEITSLSPPTATDNCAGKITGFQTLALPINTQGTHALLWTFEDGNGNTSTQTQIVLLKDDIAPVPDELFLSSLTILIDTEAPRPTATDNCQQNVKVNTLDPTNFPIPGTYLIGWIFEDTHGNISEQEQDVLVLGTLTGAVNNYITPNNDGVNDYLLLKNILRFPKNSVQVFTRTGRPVYKQLNAKNHWDGHGNIEYHERVPRGIYYYIIDYYRGNTTQFVGWVYVDY